MTEALPPAPTVLVVGFLGAGKTTFIRSLLPQLADRGLEPYVLINDYENADIDAGSLRPLADAVEAIDGSCVCCDSIFELIDALLRIERTEKRVVLIEANGTTDPFSLIEHFSAQPELRRRFAPLLQVGVIDLGRWQQRGEHNDLENLQAESASHFFFTRGETVGVERTAKVQGDLEWLNPRSVKTDAVAFADELARLVMAPERGPAPVETKREGLRIAVNPDHSLAHGFVSLQLDLPHFVKGKELHQWLRDLPRTVLRVKGVVQLEEFPEIYFMFQRTDDALGQPTIFPLPARPTMPPCAVLIGVRLDGIAIRNSIDEYLSPPAASFS